jgi:uncharacterized DUF497 family protein
MYEKCDKAREQQARHGVSLELARSFDFEDAKIAEDDDIDLRREPARPVSCTIVST